MNRETIEKKTENIFRKIFPASREITKDTDSSRIREWDSLNHVLLISEIEKEFNIRFSLDDMLAMRSFGEICDGIERNIKK